ncbi:hypothetical protein JCM18237_22430 [Halorubrum luteum]
MERIVTVVPEAGLHARPASKLVRAAKEFDAETTIEPVDGDIAPASAASMLSVTGLNVAQGDRVRIVAEGPDAAAALDAIEAILTEPVDEGDDDTGEKEGVDHE